MQQRRRGGMQEASFFSNIFFALFPHILLHEFTSRMVSNKMSVTARITDAATNGNMAHDTRWISLKNQIYFCTSAPRKTLGVTGDCRRYRRACQLASSPTRPCLLPRLCSCLMQLSEVKLDTIYDCPHPPAIRGPSNMWSRLLGAPVQVQPRCWGATCYSCAMMNLQGFEMAGTDAYVCMMRSGRPGYDGAETKQWGIGAAERPSQGEP